MKEQILGLDLGGSNIRGAVVGGYNLPSISGQPVNAKGSAEEVLESLFHFTDQLVHSKVEAIGIGVPGLIDSKSGIVFDVVNIPSWKEIPLKQLMEERYHLPVYVNNDANCFALGEYYFGKGRGHHSMIGLTIGTGLGTGIIINKKLYTGKNCGAGEFGMIDYLDQCFEYYCSGQFFENIYGLKGEEVFQRATEGHVPSINMFEEMGNHLGNAIKTILYALDVDLIVLGGSVRKAFPFFSRTMWHRVHSFAFKKTVAQLQIELSELENAGILGAAALHYDFLES